MTVPFGYALALLVAFAVTLVLVPPVSRLAVRLGLLDRPRPHRFHREATPYLGGVAVARGPQAFGSGPAEGCGKLTTHAGSEITDSFEWCGEFVLEPAE